MEILDYKAFESYYQQDEEEWFTEKYEKEIIEFEQRLEKEIKGFSLDKFWEDLEELDKVSEFEDDLTKPFSKWWDELYTGKYNAEYGDNEVTQEYLRVSKSIDIESSKSFQNYNLKQKSLKSALMKNVVEKHWNEWKAIYQKWIETLHQKRGYLSGKRFGL
jgi:hypothetical protein